MVLYIPCQQFRGCKSVGVFICIVYILQTIRGMYVSWCFHLHCIYHANNSWEFMSVGVFIGDVFVMPTIWGMYSWCFHWYCIYHARGMNVIVNMMKQLNMANLVILAKLVNLFNGLNLTILVNLVILVKLVEFSGGN